MDTWMLINYFDVWGNAEEGWMVNDACVEFDDLYMDSGSSKEDMVNYLKSIGFFREDVSLEDLYIEDMGENIEFMDAVTLQPICCLRITL